MIGWLFNVLFLVTSLSAKEAAVREEHFPQVPDTAETLPGDEDRYEIIRTIVISAGPAQDFQTQPVGVMVRINIPNKEQLIRELEPYLGLRADSQTLQGVELITHSFLTSHAINCSISQPDPTLLEQGTVWLWVNCLEL